MTGLTTLKAGQLAPLAESWRTPATAVVSNGEMIRYDASQRAYLLTGVGSGTFSITLHGSKQSPVINPAVVVEDWHDLARFFERGDPLIKKPSPRIESLASVVLRVVSMLADQGDSVVPSTRIKVRGMVASSSRKSANTLFPLKA